MTNNNISNTKPYTRVINLTAHDVHDLVTGNVYPARGRQARVTSNRKVVSYINGTPLYNAVFDEITGLPEPEHNTIYIVSAVVLNAAPLTRIDVVAPGVVKRDGNKILGCDGFRYNGSN